MGSSGLACIAVLLLVTIRCHGNKDKPSETYIDMYREGRESYSKERWFETVEYLEKALEDWQWYRHELAQCRIKCKKFSEDLKLDQKLTHADLAVAGQWILNAACQKKCKREKFGSRKQGQDQSIDSDFESLEPYNYLQLAYYKGSQFVGKYQELIMTNTHQADFLEKAIQCAYTYLLAHPDDSQMRKNLDFYKSIPYTKDSMFVNREEPAHQRSYKLASLAYDADTPDFKAVKENMEAALTEYYSAYKDCEAHCERPMAESSQNEGYTEDLYTNAADHLSLYVNCAIKCPMKLASFLGEPIENYLANHYHYLQFASFKDDIDTAAMACSSYLKIHPKDEDMLKNLKFFKSRIGDKDDGKFVPDPRVVSYLHHLQEIKSLKSYIDDNYKIARDAWNKTLHEPVLSDDHKKELKPSFTPDQIVPISSEELAKLKMEFSIELHADATKLNGTHRVSFDSLSSSEECSRMIELASSGLGGDGYGRFKGSGSHPHTPHESFEGLTVAKAAELAEERKIKWEDAWTYLDMAERVRAVTEKYFKLPTKLYFSFTHLVCRTAEATHDHTGRQENDLSHPIHSDNCNLQEDGTCIYTYPAFTWRDFSSILYLNDDFEGGNFIFANPDKTVQAELKPACGRFVSFHNGLDNLHGVKSVTSGRRCALALWYTLDPKEHERGQESHEAARTTLTRLKIESQESSDDTADSETNPDSIDDVIAANDVSVEDLDSGGYAHFAFQGPEKHNEL